MVFYGVVSAQTERVVEFFLVREAAEAMIREVREDEPVLGGGAAGRGDRDLRSHFRKR
jgi:hypothetical protein